MLYCNICILNKFERFIHQYQQLQIMYLYQYNLYKFMEKLNKQQKMVVIGAGPAGISAIGALLDFGYQNITWIDKRFSGGQFQYFISIPSNISISLVNGYATKFKSFTIFQANGTSQSKVAALQDQQCCNNDDIKSVLLTLTKIVEEHYSNRVRMIKDEFIKLTQTDKNEFIVETNTQIIYCSKVFLCLGGNPKKLPNYKPEIQRLDLYSILSPILIEQYDFTNQVIQVHGSLHSAVLALKNLVQMKKPPKKIHNFVNKEITFKQIKNGVCVSYGVGGVSKVFGKQYLNGKYSHIIEKHFQLIDVPETTKIIEAIGLQPRKFNFVSNQKSCNYEIIDNKLYSDGRQIKNCFLSGMIAPYRVFRCGRRVKSVLLNMMADFTYQLIQSLQ